MNRTLEIELAALEVQNELQRFLREGEYFRVEQAKVCLANAVLKELGLPHEILVDIDPHIAYHFS